MENVAGFNVIRRGDIVESLDIAWADEKTFILLPEKIGVGESWLRDQLEKIPTSHSENRFGLLTSGSTGEPKIILGVRKRSEKLAKKHNCSSNDIALSWVINQNFPSYAIIGPKNKSELTFSMNSLNVELSEEEKKWLSLI